MNNSKKVWVPKGLPRNQAQALSVQNPGSKPMTLDLYRHLLAAKLSSLIQADPQEALGVMEMSMEELPELYSIAQQQPVREWASAIVWGDTLMPILAQVTTQGTVESVPEQSLRQVIEALF